MKVIFLDRDGVINEFPGNGNYVTKVKDFHFLPRACEAIRKMTEKGYLIFVVSNQAGVRKGVFTEAKLNRITNHMLKQIKKEKGEIKKVFYCTHRSDHGCDCRKPEIGLIRKALQSVKKPVGFAKKTFFVGDTEIDILAGHKAGCKTIFVLSGRENRRKLRRWRVQPDFIAKDLFAAVKIIEHENSNHSRLSRSRASKGRRSSL